MHFSRLTTLACSYFLFFDLHAKEHEANNVALPKGTVEIAPDGAWTWFNDERAIFHGDFLYTGYVRADGHVGLTRFNPKNAESHHMTLSTKRAQQKDDHNNPSITALSDGRLLVVYAKHNAAKEFYFRISKDKYPKTDDDWSEEFIRSTPSACTYANTYRLTEEGNTIYNFSRSWNFNPTLNLSKDEGTSFEGPLHFIKTGAGGTRPYPRYVSNDKNRIDLIYTDGHPRVVNNSIYHLYYQDGAFRKTDGTIVKKITDLPLLHDDGERGTEIYKFSTKEWNENEGPNDFIPNGRAWTWDIHYGKDGHPVIAFQVQVNQVAGQSWQDDRIYYYYARWTGSEWKKQFIAQAGCGIYNKERDYGGGMCIDPENPNTVYISSNAKNPFNLKSIKDVPLSESKHYEIYKGITEDDGETFKWEAITENSAGNNYRPIIPKNHKRKNALVWFYGKYETYLKYTTKVIGKID